MSRNATGTYTKNTNKQLNKPFKSKQIHALSDVMNFTNIAHCITVNQKNSKKQCHNIDEKKHKRGHVKIRNKRSTHI